MWNLWGAVHECLPHSARDLESQWERRAEAYVVGAGVGVGLGVGLVVDRGMDASVMWGQQLE